MLYSCKHLTIQIVKRFAQGLIIVNCLKLCGARNLTVNNANTQTLHPLFILRNEQLVQIILYATQ